ncbi:hypothetical protein JCM17823_29930 [Halorubrum gandharaense]
MTESEASDDDSRGRLRTALASVWTSIREFHEGYSDVGSIHAGRDAKRRQESATAEDDDSEGETPAEDPQHASDDEEHASHHDDSRQ